MKRTAPLLATIATALLMAACLSTDEHHVDSAPAPMLNGLIGEAEWDSASTIDSGWDQGTVWIRSDSHYVYLCIASRDTVHTGMDLYLDNTFGDVFMLHISSAHGQRFLVDSVWQDMNWGSADLWTSNLIQSIYQDGRNVWLAPDAFEFQIDRHLLPCDTFRMVLHFKRPERWVPDGADTLSSANWLSCGMGSIADNHR